MLDKIFHRLLKAPYALHARVIESDQKAVATVLFIHGIGNTGEVWNGVITKLPKDIRVITIDLLGFGQSPRPDWATYNAKIQARSVLATILKLRLFGPIIVVGHSLGALVAVDVAKRYPLLIKSLILCSPPFYQLNYDEKRLLPSSDKILKDIFKTVKKHPEQFLQFASVATRYKLINAVFNVSPDNIGSYMGTLEAAIINQTSIDDIKKIKQPILIIHGILDPLVVDRNIKKLGRNQANITVKSVLAGHEVKGLMSSAVIGAIQKEI